MLTITPVSVRNQQYLLNVKKANVQSENSNVQERNLPKNAPYAEYMIGGGRLPFQARLTGDIEHEQYMKMTEKERELLRIRYDNFYELNNHIDTLKREFKLKESDDFFKEIEIKLLLIKKQL